MFKKGHPKYGGKKKGMPTSEETKRKISIANKGQVPWNKGKHWSKIIKEKIGKANKGRLISKNNPMYGIHRFGKDSPMWGKHHSTETKEKISNKQKGKYQGSNNPNWKGGKKISYGYVYIYQSNHPFCDKHNYIFEHRLIVEKHIGRYLKPTEKTHHLGAKDDNRPQKLMAFINHSAHKRFHNNPNNVKVEEIIFDGRKL